MEALYNPTKFNPLRGGHAPGHLRQAFLDALEHFFVEDDDNLAAEAEAGAVSLKKLPSLLYNCSATLPQHYHSYVADIIELNRDFYVTWRGSGHTYAQTAQHIIYYHYRLSAKK